MKTTVISLRVNPVQIEKIAWLKSKRINPAVLIRNSFDEAFDRFKKEYEKEQVKEILPF